MHCRTRKVIKENPGDTLLKPTLNRSCRWHSARILGINLAILACLVTIPVLAEDGAQISPAKFDDMDNLLIVQTDQQRFEIPAGSLESALLQFSQQVDRQLLYPAYLTTGIKTQGVQGTYSSEEALIQLLTDTGLAYRIEEDKTITLESATVKQERSSTEEVGNTPRLKLAQVVVEGERRPLTVAETASSVAVVTGEDLKDIAGPTTIETVFRQIPNVIINGKSNLAATIRGNDTTGVLSGAPSFLGGARPRTTIQLDGRPLSYNEYIFGTSSVWDVNRVEVFRGPQTTTQGRNSIAGAIFIETNDPTYDYEMRARALGGNFETLQFSGVASGPLIEDQLAARFSFDVRDHESFVNVQGLTADIGADPTEDDYRNVRGKLLFEPSAVPDLTTKLTYSYIETTRPQTELVNAPFKQRNRLNPGFSVFQTEAHTIILDGDYGITKDLEIRNTFSYSDSEIRRRAPAGQGVAKIENDQYTAESILDYTNKAVGVQGILGVSALVSRQDDLFDASALGVGVSTFKDNQESLGIFGEVTWTPFDPFDVTVGLRYQRDHQDRDGGQGTPLIADFEKTFDAVLPKFGLAYHVTDNLTVGTTVKRGFNAGGFTIALAPPFSPDIFKEEFVWNYEAFWRSSWLEDRLLFNGNIFFADYEDQQRFATRIVLGNPVTEIDNAEKARAYGLEMDLRFLATNELEVFGSLGLLETEIRKFTSSTGLPLNGNDFQRAPTITSNFGFRYEPLQGLVLSAQGQYVDSYFSDDNNTSGLKVDDYFVANAQLAYTYKYIRVFTGVTNIFDSFYELQQLAFGTAQVGDPREYVFGVEVFFP